MSLEQPKLVLMENALGMDKTVNARVDKFFINFSEYR